MALLDIGTQAPDFSILNHDNQLISLGQFRGKWVVTYFYPKAMTSGCTVQACGLRDAMPDLTRLGAVVLGISPDKPSLLKKFVEHDRLTFHLLSDELHHVAETYGTWQEKSMYGRTYMGMARVTYIISPVGEISHVISKVNTASHADDVVAWMKEHAV